MTESTASGEELLKPLPRFSCDHWPGEHETLTGPALSRMRIYPGPLCEGIVTGIINVGIKDQEYGALPNVGASSEAQQYTPKPLPAKGLGCPACHASMRYGSPMHTRNAKTCRWADIVSTAYGCPACKSSEEMHRNPRSSDKEHTHDIECRFKDAQPEAEGRAEVRVGAHPRDPRPVAKPHPS